jgi:dTDP-4-dehydrorhamnose reductase
MTILLVGAQGQLGHAVQQLAHKKNIPLQAFSRAALDITNINLLRACFAQFKPTFVINAAAFTAVDLAETEVTAAMQLNAEAPKILANLCAEYDCVLIHPSTDYVFDGNASHPYIEEDEPNPLSVYGESKLRGEIGIKSAQAKYIILRVSWVFGLDGKNFVKTILRLAQEKQSVSIVSDQIGCPTAAYHIAQVIFKLIAAINNQNTHFGVYHYCDQPALSWYDFALKIISTAKQHTTFPLEEIKPIMTCDYPTPATRPMNVQLDCSKIERDYHIQRYDWSCALEHMIKKIYGNFL